MTTPGTGSTGREGQTFVSRLGMVTVMIGVAAGLGNVWRFPYMVGKFGGLAFVLAYLAAVLFIAVPALMAEWTLGRHTRRGPAGAYVLAGFPMGRAVGWLLFAVTAGAAAYYTAAIGWVLFHGMAELARGFGFSLQGHDILPPGEGFVARSFFLQLGATSIVLIVAALVLIKGVRAGTERVSRILTPALFISLLIVVARSLTLPGSFEGVRYFLFRFEPSSLTPAVFVAALGQAVFSMGLGGTLMVAYGSFLRPKDDLRSLALWTAGGDTAAGMLAGLAIFPAAFALGVEAGSGPALMFTTLPGIFAAMPAGWVIGFVFFASLFGAAYLSDIAAFEVLVSGLTDNTGFGRGRAVWMTMGLIFVLSIPPTINMKIFVPWDLVFGSGMQTLGALLAVLAVGWFVKRSTVLAELGIGEEGGPPAWLYLWMRYVVPVAIVAVGVWWALTDLLGIVSGV